LPTIEVSYSDLCSLIGQKISIEELKQYMNFAKAGIEAAEGDLLKIEVKDTNRPDLWSTEGIARELKGRLTNERGLPKYKIEKSDVVVEVNRKVSKVRPLTVCAVAKNLKMNEAMLSQLIQLQEKVAGTFGRGRKEVAIGVYDLSRIKPPIKYTTAKLDKKFVPLDFEEEMSIKEILEKHPKGKEFGHLVKGLKEIPIFIDSTGEVLSIPPIINSNYTGKVTEDTKEVFIECSGFDFKFLVPALNVLAAALIDRGAKVESVKVIYPNKSMHTPDLTPKKASVEVDLVNKVSGLKLPIKEIIKLLEQARYEPKLKGKKIEVLYPAYRQDIMHAVDVVEDVIISYGYNKIEPESIRYKTKGEINKLEIFTEGVIEKVAGLGFQEIISYTLTNKEHLFKKMNVKEEKVVEIENPVSMNWNVFRNWLLPSLMEFYSNNQHVAYPQKIFEVGDVVLIDEKQETRTRDVKKLTAAIADSKVAYDDIAAVLDAFLSSLKIKYKLRKNRYESFIEGRSAEILVNNKPIGFIGELHPTVLKNWKMEMPVAAFEIDLEMIHN
jgi:phenylalanyl-tRNA synthetase beta chain